MPYNTVIVFAAFDILSAADLNNNFANLDYLNTKVSSQIMVTADRMAARSTSGATPSTLNMATNVNHYAGMDFPDGSSTYAHFGFPMPSDYNGGTITARFYWTANSTSGNAVVWAIQAVCIADDESLDVAFGTAQARTDANKTSAYDLNISDESPAVTIAGTPAAGEFVLFQVYRSGSSGSDTLAATATLLAVEINYTRS